MSLARRPGGYALLYEYDVSRRAQAVQQKRGLCPATARSELVGGYDNWRLQVDFWKQRGEWKVSRALLARRPDSVDVDEFRDWLNERFVPDVVFLVKADVKRILTLPPIEWEAVWLTARRRQAKGKEGDPEAE